MENKYCYRSRISEAKFRELIKYFSLDLEATKIVKLTGISEPTVVRYLHAIRERLAGECEASAQLLGEVEVDEAPAVCEAKGAAERVRKPPWSGY